MTGPYYYLVSSFPVLPDLGENTGIDATGVINQIRMNLGARDNQVFTCLLHLNDIKQFINVLANKRDAEDLYVADLPGSMSRDDLSDALTRGGEAPGFMEAFLRENRERMEQMTLREVEMALLDAFYQALGGISNEFLNEYLAFDKALRQITTGFNIRKYEMSDSQLLQDDLYKTIQSQSMRDFGLSKEYPFIERLADTFDKENPDQLEKFIDNVRLNHLDELEGPHFFSLENVMAYTIRLFIYKRWEALDQESGQKRLDELVNKVIEGVEIENPG